MDLSELPRLERPDKTRVVDNVVRSLEEAILTKEMPPGARLVEHALAEQLDVSRTTVREALLMLERQGLVKSTPRGGTFVTRLSTAAAWDLCKVRALLEGHAVRTGFAMYDETLFTALRQIVRAIGACKPPADVPRLVALDIAFHQSIVQRANSPHLLELWATLNGRIHALYLVTMEQLNINTPRIAGMHEQLITDLASGDYDRALHSVLNHYLDGWPRTEHETPKVPHIFGVLTIDNWPDNRRVDGETAAVTLQ